MRISDWSSDVCSSDLSGARRPAFDHRRLAELLQAFGQKAEAAKLPIAVSRIAPDAVEFSCENKKYRLVHDGPQLTELGELEPSLGPSCSSEERREGKECVSTLSIRW